MRTQLATLLLLLLTTFTFAAERPNFVFVLGDDCTRDDIGCYGGQAKTPNIDRLAAEGMKFTMAFQAAPMCSPTRHNIYTGIYPVKSGAYPNHTRAYDNVKSIVHYLGDLDYRVALAGKRHIAPQHVFNFENVGMGTIDKFFASCKEKGDSFCLFVCSNEPHSPWTKGNRDDYDADKLKLPPTYVDTPETRSNFVNYLAEIGYLDGQLGDVEKALAKNGFAKNTLLIFSSEQGNSFPFAKWTLYDAGVKTAIVARWPGKIKAGSVSDAIVEYCDIVPTFLAAAGVKENKMPKVLDGKSFLPVLLGEKKEHKEYTFSLQTTRGINNGSPEYGIRSVRDKKFRYIWNLTPEAQFKNAAQRSAVWTSWTKKAENDKFAAARVKAYQYRPGVELYDLEADPFQLNNLAENPEYADVKKKLRGELLGWMEQQGDKGKETELRAKERQGRGKQHGTKKKSGQPTPKSSKKSH